MTNAAEGAEDRNLAALNDYLSNVVQCVAWQIARNDDTLPAFFVIPPPADADQLELAHDILSDCMVSEFNNAPLPQIRYSGVSHTPQ